MGDSFINPYSFVPLPNRVRRRPAVSLEQLGEDTLSGTITAELEAISPVSVGAQALRGSSLHGAIRSIHETLTESCFRVLNTDYRPSYREPMSGRGEHGWAVVSRVAGNGAVHIRRATGPRSVIRVRTSDLRAAAGDARRVETGARLSIQPSARLKDGRGVALFAGQPSEITFRSEDSGETADDYHLLVTDVGARDPRKSTWFLAVRGDGPEQALAPDVLKAFAQAVAGTEDARLHSAGQEPFAEVRFDKGPLLGLRLRASEPLRVGQPVRVDLDDQDQVTDIALAEIWRKAVNTSVAERLNTSDPDTSVEPCTSREAVCPACALFGSADTSGDGLEQGAAQQDSLRGRVTVTDPTRVNDAGTTDLDLVLSSPKPTSGQFYLEPPRGQAKARVWRPGDNRRMRGRKHYWTSSWAQRKDQESTGNDNEAIRSTLTAFNPGTKWTATLHFEGLSRSELGGLLASLSPELLWGSDARLRLGGGKPYGLGNVKSTVTTLVLRDLEAAWTGGEIEVLAAPAPFVDDFRKDFERTDRTETWASLRALVTEDTVPTSQISYPSGRDGDPFTFWNQWRPLNAKGDSGAEPAGLPLATDRRQELRKP